MFRFLFQPFRLRSLTLRNRIICGPMEKNLCTEEGKITDRYVDYVEERARGGAGLILLESAYADRSGKARKYQMGIHDDALIPPLRRLVDRAHRRGAAVGMQLHHGGRTCQEAISGIRPMAPSPVPCKALAGGDMPWEMTRDDIRRTVEQFRRAALRSVEAGFDLVEIHGAHGYLVGQFLSPFSNKRSDNYGGSFENRCRFPVEVIRAVREAVGPCFPIMYRISADEFVDGGLGLEETLRFAKVLESEGIDLIDISAGIYESGIMIVQPMEFPLGGYVYMARAFKEAVSVPISIAGRIADPVQAEAILAEGSSDFVTMVRAFHADPHFPQKALEGRLEEICLCMACNQGCTDRLRENVPLSCIINTRAGFEREFRITPADHRKTVWVAGAGPAGLMAAGVCALRGHRVTLFEREEEPGGMARYACRPEHKADFAQVTRYLTSQAHRAGVEFRLGVSLEVSEVRRQPPDVLIVATGSVPGMPAIAGMEQLRIYNFMEAMDCPQSLGERIMVYGGGMVGGETALFLAEKGISVVLIEPGEELVRDLGPRAKWYLVKSLSSHQLIVILLNAQVEKCEQGRLIIKRQKETISLGRIDSVVMALERVPNRSLFEQVQQEGLVGQLFAVGDCVTPARVTEATHDATRIGVTI
jgi:2,4-dienoyl-CoA reductase-like NADH-dependent reductase (Old Yellow Enzyme family)/thioredoxin reductase